MAGKDRFSGGSGSQSHMNSVQQEVVDDRPFLAGSRRVMWRATLIKTGEGLLLRLQHVGARRISGMTIPWSEVPDLVRILNGLMNKVEAGSRGGRRCGFNPDQLSNNLKTIYNLNWLQRFKPPNAIFYFIARILPR